MLVSANRRKPSFDSVNLNVWLRLQRESKPRRKAYLISIDQEVAQLNLPLCCMGRSFNFPCMTTELAPWRKSSLHVESPKDCYKQKASKLCWSERHLFHFSSPRFTWMSQTYINFSSDDECQKYINKYHKQQEAICSRHNWCNVSSNIIYPLKFHCLQTQDYMILDMLGLLQFWALLVMGHCQCQKGKRLSKLWTKLHPIFPLSYGWVSDKLQYQSES